jgi:hypothetical protein
MGSEWCAIVLFGSQGFAKEIEMEKERWQG